MNWKLLVGKIIQFGDNLLVNSNSKFISKNYPYRRNLIFDLKRHLKDPQIIFDVGAYIGEFSLEVNKSFKVATVYAFEPVNASYNKFVNATSSIKKIKVFNIALGNESGTVEIPLYKEASINTLKAANYDHSPISSEKITVQRLADFVKDNNIVKIDIFKVDVEGFELEVLKGAGDFLSKVDCIIAEVGYKRTNTKTYFSDLDRFMEENGFYLFNIYDLKPQYNDRTNLFYSNNVYLKNGI